MMKLLLDSCVSRQALNELVEAGHDVLYAPDYWPKDPGDDEILKLAFDEDRVVVTIDKDFGELTVRQGLPHSGLIRLVNLRVAQQGPSCIQVIELYSQELQAQAIVTAEPGYVRIRPAHLPEE